MDDESRRAEKVNCGVTRRTSRRSWSVLGAVALGVAAAPAVGVLARGGVGVRWPQAENASDSAAPAMTQRRISSAAA
jgi:hypothetical protein